MVRLHARYRRKDFLEVDALALNKASGDETHLVLDNGAELVRLSLYTHFRLIGRHPEGGSTSCHVSFSSIAFISSKIARRQFLSRSASVNVGGSSALTSSRS